MGGRIAGIGMAAVALVLGACSTEQPPEVRSEPGWVATWAASPFGFQSFGNAAPPAPLRDQTVRQVLRISTGGEQLRIRFSNENGSTPLVIGAASVALADAESVVVDGTLLPLTFGGVPSITVPPGAPALSDPVDFSVDDLSELAVSIYFPEVTPLTTVHMGRTAFGTAAAGDFTSAPELPNAEKSTTMVFLSGVYVRPSAETGVIVALGDSITDGAASTPHTFNSWPDRLAERFATRGVAARRMAVVNHGISGNQVLRDGAGISALARFDRDVLATPGLTHVVLLEGINDIGTGGFSFGGATADAPPLRTAGDIIAGYRQLIARAHSMSPPVKIIGATLTPFEGSFAGYYTPAKDETRLEVNEWIRMSGAFDAVIDFERAIQDPDNPRRMHPDYDSGDNLHPGDVGYDRMAESIDLGIFD